MDIENAKAQMRKGVLEMCILAIISEEERYPGDIIKLLRENDLIVVEGTLYPLLTRLKNDGLLNYSWRESTNGPPRKYFKITDLGAQFLGDLTESWQQLVHAVSQTVLSSASNEREGAVPKSAPPPTPPPAEVEVEKLQSPYFES